MELAGKYTHLVGTPEEKAWHHGENLIPSLRRLAFLVLRLVARTARRVERSNLVFTRSEELYWVFVHRAYTKNRLTRVDRSQQDSEWPDYISWIRRSGFNDERHTGVGILASAE